MLFGRAGRRRKEHKHPDLKRPTVEQPVGALPDVGELGSPVVRETIDRCVHELTNGKMMNPLKVRTADRTLSVDGPCVRRGPRCGRGVVGGSVYPVWCTRSVYPPVCTPPVYIPRVHTPSAYTHSAATGAPPPTAAGSNGP